MITNGNNLNNPFHIYHSVEWTNFIEKEFNIKIKTLTIKIGSNELQLLLPIKNNVIVLPPLWAYNLPIFSSPPTSRQQIEFASLLAEELNNFKGYTINWYCNHHLYELVNYASLYYEFKLNLPLTLSSNMKESMRKLKKRGYLLSTKIEEKEFISLFELLEKRYKYSGKKIPYTLNTFLNVTRQPFIKNFILNYNNEIAFISVGLYNKNAYGILNVGKNNDVLKILVMDELYKMGIETFWFVGANTSNIIHHKLRLNPETVSMIRIHKPTSYDKFKQYIKGVLSVRKIFF